MDSPVTEMVKVRFSLAQDEDGWPSVGSEGLWAEAVGPDLYRIDNTPWFVRNLAADDVVVALSGSGEGSNDQYGLVALDVPPDVDLVAVKRLLEAGRADGRWDFDEGCVNEAWVAI